MNEPVDVLVSLDTEWFQRWGLSYLTYGRELKRVDLHPNRIDFGEVTDAESFKSFAQRMLEGKHGLMLTGGGDVNPTLYGSEEHRAKGVEYDRDALEMQLLKLALERQLPVLGICRGAQLINVAHGGTIANLRSDRAQKRKHKSPLLGHSVAVEPESFLARTLQKNRLSRVTSNHGQAVDQVGAGLRACAWAADDVIEGIEADTAEQHFQILGLQFHPEAWSTTHQRRIFKSFARAVFAHADATDSAGT